MGCYWVCGDWLGLYDILMIRKFTLGFDEMSYGSMCSLTYIH